MTDFDDEEPRGGTAAWVVGVLSVVSVAVWLVMAAWP